MYKDYMNEQGNIFMYPKNMVDIYYNLGLTFITLAFISLIYQKIILKTIFKIPKTFLLLYMLGGFFLIIKNIKDNHIYIAINELIGFIISIILLVN